MWIPAQDANPALVLRVDPTTYTVTDRLTMIDVNTVAVDDHTLWTASGKPFNLVQRFDVSTD